MNYFDTNNENLKFKMTKRGLFSHSIITRYFTMPINGILYIDIFRCIKIL